MKFIPRGFPTLLFKFYQTLDAESGKKNLLRLLTEVEMTLWSKIIRITDAWKKIHSPSIHTFFLFEVMGLLESVPSTVG